MALVSDCIWCSWWSLQGMFKLFVVSNTYSPLQGMRLCGAPFRAYNNGEIARLPYIAHWYVALHLWLPSPLINIHCSNNTGSCRLVSLLEFVSRCVHEVLSKAGTPTRFGRNHDPEHAVQGQAQRAHCTSSRIKCF